MPERVSHGANGFICATAIEFQRRILEDTTDAGELISMRRKTLDYAVSWMRPKLGIRSY
jgi:hypothetical protein